MKPEVRSDCRWFADGSRVNNWKAKETQNKRVSNRDDDDSSRAVRCTCGDKELDVTEPSQSERLESDLCLF